MNFTIKPLTPDRWADFEDLFNNQVEVDDCWCMWWRIGSDINKHPPAENKAAFQQIVKQGPPPGLLAYKDNLCVGWCQLTPRNALPELEKHKHLKPLDDLPVWAISCFFIRKDYRKQGVMTALINAAIDIAREIGVSALEAYPRDSNQSPGTAFTGYISTFERAGFKLAGKRDPSRPIMRYVFKQNEDTEIPFR